MKNPIPSHTPTTLGYFIKAALKAKHLKQKDLAQMMKTDTPTVSRLINGQRKPTLDQLRVLYHQLNMYIDTLLSEIKHHITKNESL